MPDEPIASNFRHVKRPWSISLVIVILIIITAACLYRSIWYAIHWQFVISLTRPFNCWFVINTSLFSAFFTLLVGIWLWQARSFTRVAYSVWFGVLTSFFWMEKLVFSMNSTAQTDWIFSLLVNLLLGFASTAILSSAKVHGYFERQDLHD